MILPFSIFKFPGRPTKPHDPQVVNGPQMDCVLAMAQSVQDKPLTNELGEQSQCHRLTSSHRSVRSLITSLLFLILTLGCIVVSSPALMAADSTAPAAENSDRTETKTHEQHEEHGLTQQALEIARPFGLPVTNSMLVSWLVALGLIVFAQLSTRRMERVPKGAQNFWEWLVESLSTFLEGVIGRHLVQRTFWFFATIFIFVLSSNWAGLIPGVGTIGWKVQFADGHSEWHPLFRGANADLNMTLAMALVFFACWIFWAIREVGLAGFYKELFAPKGESAGFLKVLLVVVFFAAGCLEVISILFRPVSLSFRLYGNIFAGENMLETMGKLVPGFGWLLPIPFYFLELLVGLVQAMVFMLLTAVFTLLICQHEEPAGSTAHE